MKSRKEDFKSIGKSSKQLLQRRRDEFSLKIKEARRKKLMHKRKFLSEDAASVEITEQQLQEQIEKLENKKTSDTICESLAFIAKSLSTTENEQWIIRKLYNEAYIFFKLKKFLQSPNERVVMETLHLLVNLAACINLNNDEVDDGDVEQAGELNNDNDGMDDDDNVDKPLLSIEQLVEKQCMAFVVDVIPYLSSSVTSYLELSCWFLANVAANGQVEAQTLVENGCVAPLLTLLRGNDVDERVLRAALFALSNVVKFAGSGGLAEQLIGDQVPRGCVTLLADSNRAMPLRAEAAWLLCNVCDWSNLKHNNDLAGMLIALFSQLQLAAVFDTIQAPSPLVIPLVRVWISVCSLLSFVPVSLKWNATSSSLQTLALWLSQLLSNPTTNDTKLKEISYLLSIITFHTDLIKTLNVVDYLPKINNLLQSSTKTNNEMRNFLTITVHQLAQHDNNIVQTHISASAFATMVHAAVQSDRVVTHCAMLSLALLFVESVPFRAVIQQTPFVLQSINAWQLNNNEPNRASLASSVIEAINHPNNQ